MRYHAVIADRIALDDSILARASARVDGWLRDGSVATYYAAGWKEILSRPKERIRAFLTDGSEKACAFRQVSPFAGVLNPRERWRLWASVDDGDDATTA